MTEPARPGEEKPQAKPRAGSETPDPKPADSAAEDLNRQDKTKDKPASGQNEDG